MVVVLAVATLKLVWVQTIQADELRAAADRQTTTPVTLLAERGSILDRLGSPLAFSIESAALTTNPKIIAKRADAATYIPEMARAVAQGTGQDEASVLAKLTTDRGYVVLATKADPEIGRALGKKFVEIKVESREDRQYPGGTLAANVIGAAGWDGERETLSGRLGLESSQDNVLAGAPGKREAATAEGSNTVIPGSIRFERPAVKGSTIQLTLDSDLQFTVQRALSDYVARTGAKPTSSAVVLDASTAEVLALATGHSFDPRNYGAYPPEQTGNAAVTNVFEPGSVNKIVTMAAALDMGVAKPDDVLTVPGSIRVADRTISDAWEHGPERYTLTGVLAKSSNVGTLMTAEKVGKQRFAEMLAKFGLGTKTGVGLPSEAPGSVLPLESWSGSTFGNLPIGQGLNMTVLQMAGMYQAVANNGLRVPPRIVSSIIGPDGVRQVPPPPAPVQVVSPETAATLRTMLIAVTQDVRGAQRGTGPQAAVPGYQVAGKTGTAQQIDPRCRCYSNSTYWITFAGMIPAQDPRYVIAIMLDAPGGGTSAAPLFHDIATYLAQRERIPVSNDPPLVQTLVAP
ncbi:peptidoglycan D,D-transpeptidase FtsI family protein [Pseudonocardia sp. TRM90224]|uniref:peptidoglycan D,D-transpeptidase FtsI family protein n=1 Tax=Pseudonocardia sp. TRM90224 TaxID=2812678 RepID=UPI001E2DAC0F|nr:penicillin-binding protein 2 [Pseudonocardia sp. TRM90224]